LFFTLPHDCPGRPVPWHVFTFASVTQQEPLTHFPLSHSQLTVSLQLLVVEPHLPLVNPAFWQDTSSLSGVPQSTSSPQLLVAVPQAPAPRPALVQVVGAVSGVPQRMRCPQLLAVYPHALPVMPAVWHDAALFGTQHEFCEHALPAPQVFPQSIRRPQLSVMTPHLPAHVTSFVSGVQQLLLRQTSPAFAQAHRTVVPQLFLKFPQALPLF